MFSSRLFVFWYPSPLPARLSYLQRHCTVLNVLIHTRSCLSGHDCAIILQQYKLSCWSPSVLKLLSISFACLDWNCALFVTKRSEMGLLVEQWQPMLRAMIPCSCAVAKAVLQFACMYHKLPTAPLAHLTYVVVDLAVVPLPPHTRRGQASQSLARTEHKQTAYSMNKL